MPIRIRHRTPAVVGGRSRRATEAESEHTDQHDHANSDGEPDAAPRAPRFELEFVGHLGRDGSRATGRGAGAGAEAREGRLGDASLHGRVERLRQRLHRAVAFVGILRERPEDDHLELGTDDDVGVHLVQRRNLFEHVLREDAHEAVADEGSATGQAFVEDHAQGVDVDATIRGLPGRLLGRHVLGRAEDHARLGQLATGRALGLDVVHLRDAEVDDGDEVGDLVARGQEDVLGLHVAMYDALALSGAERSATLLHQAHGARRRQRALDREQVREVLPVEVLHHEVARARRRLAEVGDVDDVSVADLRRALGLELEALDHLGSLGEVVAQHLDGHALLDAGVLGFVHQAHAAFADAPLHAIAARQDRTDQGIGGIAVRAADLGRRDQTRRVHGTEDLAPGVGLPTGRA